MEKIGIVGAGLIGRAWAMVFARAGHPVTMYDADACAMSERARAHRSRLQGAARVRG